MKKIYIFVFAVCFALPLRSQEVYTNLKDPGHVTEFYKVSNLIICQCDCHYLLSQCPHVDCGFAIPVRRFIESLIREGVEAEAIANGLVHGFGDNMRNDPRILAFVRDGRQDLASGVVNGFGYRISGRSSTPVQMLIILGFCALAVSLFAYWWRRNRRRSRAEPVEPAGESEDIPELEDFDR